MRPALVCLVLAAALGCGRAEPELIEPRSLVALPEGGAITLWTDRDAWLTRLDENGAPQWTRRLDDRPVFPSRDNPLAIAADVVLLREVHDAGNERRLRLAAYSRSDGKRRWHLDLGTAPATEAEAYSFTRVVSGDSVFEGVGGRGLIPSTVLRIDARRGSVERRFGWPEHGRLLVSPPRVVVEDVHVATVFDGQEESRYEIGGPGCIRDRTYAHVERVNGAQRLVLARRGEPVVRFELDVSSAVVEGVIGCAFRGNSVVVALRSRGGALLLRVDPDGHVRRLKLGGHLYAPLFVDTHGATVFGTSLPRFVPLLVSWDSSHKLLLVDLDSFRTEWCAQSDLLSTFQVDDRWYLEGRRDHLKLAVIDGATGRITGSVQLVSHSPLDDIRPEHISRAGLWIGGLGVWAVKEPWVRLDPDRLIALTVPPFQVMSPVKWAKWQEPQPVDPKCMPAT